MPQFQSYPTYFYWKMQDGRAVANHMISPSPDVNADGSLHLQSFQQISQVQQAQSNAQPMQAWTNVPRRDDSIDYPAYPVTHVSAAENPFHNPYPRLRRNSLQTPPAPVYQPPVSMHYDVYRWPGSREGSLERLGNRDRSRSQQPSIERTGRRDQNQFTRGQSVERTDHRGQTRRGQSVERANANESRGRQPGKSAVPHGDPESRPFLKEIADTTIAAINNGMADVNSTQKNTCLFREDASQLIKWRSAKRARRNAAPAEINVLPLTTLEAAKDLHTQSPHKRIGILNFASATKPGGGFLSGARAQEESIARSSTLYVSLTTATARPFYATHAHDEKGGFYTHAMIYSPAIYIMRMDDGEWLPSQIKVDVLTCAAVNAGDVRKKNRQRDIEKNIRDVMRERMGRILALFERKGARQIVLGSFGTGVFQNDVQSMAGLWNELLYAPNAPFTHSFDHVVFAIPDQETRRKFALGFKTPDLIQDGVGSSTLHR